MANLDPPLFSRNTGYDEEEEHELSLREPIFTWAPSVAKELKGKALTVDTLLIGCNSLSSLSVQFTLYTSKIKPVLIGSMILHSVPLNTMKASHPSTGNECVLIYRLPGKSNLVVALYKSDKSLDCSFYVANSLFHHITPKNVCILDTILAQKAEVSIAELSKLSVVETSVSKDEKKIETKEYLKSPYMVKGLSAGLISHCEIRKVKARLFVGYEDIHKSLRTCLSFIKILSSSPLSLGEKSLGSWKEKEKLKQLSLFASGIGYKMKGLQGAAPAHESNELPPEGVYI